VGVGCGVQSVVWSVKCRVKRVECTGQCSVECGLQK